MCAQAARRPGLPPDPNFSRHLDPETARLLKVRQDIEIDVFELVCELYGDKY